jgi:hypothetical protein
MKRVAALVAAAAVLMGITASSAFGTSCAVVGKPVGAGQAGTATVDVATGTFTITSLNLTPSGNLQGNFLTVTVMAGPVVLDLVSVFGKKDLPDGAHLSGPGGTQCDGVGIDDLAECGS